MRREDHGPVFDLVQPLCTIDSARLQSASHLAIVDKRTEGEKKIIELEVVTIAEGQPSVRGNVAVELPSRG